jgi:hypothetical protein
MVAAVVRLVVGLVLPLDLDSCGLASPALSATLSGHVVLKRAESRALVTSQLSLHTMTEGELTRETLSIYVKRTLHNGQLFSCSLQLSMHSKQKECFCAYEKVYNSERSHDVTVAEAKTYAAKQTNLCSIIGEANCALYTAFVGVSIVLCTGKSTFKL